MKGIEKIGARGKPSTELSRDFFEGEGPLPLQTVGNIALLCGGKESPPHSSLWRNTAFICEGKESPPTPSFDGV